MIGPRPKFMDSPYFVGEPGNWHLRPGAPPSVVAEFAAFTRRHSRDQDLTGDVEIQSLRTGL